MISAQQTTDNDTAVAEKPGLFTIENSSGTKLIVSNYGAAVQSLFVKDMHGKPADIVLGYEDAQEYVKDEFYIGTVVGRYANRINGDRVLIDDKEYKLSSKPGGYHLHGGDIGFNKKFFTAAPFFLPNARGIIFKYTSPHMEEGFPGELQLEVIYTLDDDDQWTVEYKAISDKTTIINLTQHTYFNLTGDPSKTVDDHELKIDSNYYLPVNNMQVPTGKLEKVNNTAFDFSRFKKIATDIAKDNEQLHLGNGYDHSFVLEHHHTPALKHAAVVKETSSGRRMDVYTTEPAIHFYSGNFLKNVKGKKGIVYNKRAGFCLETQHFPDAPNQPHFPSTILNAGEKFYSKTIFKFSVE